MRRGSLCLPLMLLSLLAAPLHADEPAGDSEAGKAATAEMPKDGEATKDDSATAATAPKEEAAARKEEATASKKDDGEADAAKPATEPAKKNKKPKPIPYTSGIPWDEPEHVEPGATNLDPPSDAIVLFDGTNLDAWEGATDKWIFKHGYAIAGGRIKTKQAFGDCQLHLEFQCPIEDLDSGQGKGNNGVGLMNAQYEIQILDSYENETYFDGQASAVYKQHPPLVNASRPTGQWQTYDILFTAPKFNEDKSLASPAYVTVLHNGVVTQLNFELKGDTNFMRPPKYTPHAEKLPLVLYYHTDPVRFRNIWIRDLSGEAGKAQLAEEKKQMTAKPMAKAAK